MYIEFKTRANEQLSLNQRLSICDRNYKEETNLDRVAGTILYTVKRCLSTESRVRCYAILVRRN